jgi:hypothetical protein
MKDDKHLVIHFNNGTEMEVSFPTPDQEFTWRPREAAKRILEGDGITGPHPVGSGAAHL